jgi:hypothetical protein
MLQSYIVTFERKAPPDPSALDFTSVPVTGDGVVVARSDNDARAQVLSLFPNVIIVKCELEMFKGEVKAPDLIQPTAKCKPVPTTSSLPRAASLGAVATPNAHIIKAPELKATKPRWWEF